MSEDCKTNDLEYIKISVDDPMGNRMPFRLNMKCSLGKLMSAYCNQHHVTKSSRRFFFNGNRIGDKDTPLQLGMKQDGESEYYTSMRLTDYKSMLAKWRS